MYALILMSVFFFMQEEQFLDNAITAFRMEIATMVNEFLLNQGILVSSQL